MKKRKSPSSFQANIKLKRLSLFQLKQWMLLCRIRRCLPGSYGRFQLKLFSSHWWNGCKTDRFGEPLRWYARSTVDGTDVYVDGGHGKRIDQLWLPPETLRGKHENVHHSNLSPASEFFVTCTGDYTTFCASHSYLLSSLILLTNVYLCVRQAGNYQTQIALRYHSFRT